MPLCLEEAFYWKESLTPNPPSFVLAAAASLPLTAASHGRLAAARPAESHYHTE